MGEKHLMLKAIKCFFMLNRIGHKKDRYNLTNTFKNN